MFDGLIGRWVGRRVGRCVVGTCLMGPYMGIWVGGEVLHGWVGGWVSRCVVGMCLIGDRW